MSLLASDGDAEGDSPKSLGGGAENEGDLVGGSCRETGSCKDLVTVAAGTWYCGAASGIDSFLNEGAGISGFWASGWRHLMRFRIVPGSGIDKGFRIRKRRRRAKASMCCSAGIDASGGPRCGRP